MPDKMLLIVTIEKWIKDRLSFLVRTEQLLHINTSATITDV